MNSLLPKGLRFTLIHRTFRQQLDATVKEFDLTGVQFGVLAQLSRLEHSDAGEITQKILEEATHTTHPTMTEILKKLEKKGFVTCSASETDRRCKVISSTEKSRTLQLQMKECDERIFTALCAGISPEEIEILLRVSEQMLKNAKNLSGCTCRDEKGANKL